MDFAVPRRSLEVHGRPFPTAPYWWRWHMEGARIVIPLVALVLPIAMLLAALVVVQALHVELKATEVFELQGQ